MSKGGLSQADFARVMGVDRSQVTRWAASGLPMLAENTVDAAAGAEWVRANVSNHKVRGSIGARQLERGERARLGRDVRIAYTVADETNAYAAAELLLPHLPEPVVRAIVAELLKRSRAGSAECLDEDFVPPGGFASWLDTPEFQKQVPTDGDWTVLLTEHAAGKLAKVGAKSATQQESHSF
jgi:transcriptional regulator with XRE-family HTH domain